MSLSIAIASISSNCVKMASPISASKLAYSNWSWPIRRPFKNSIIYRTQQLMMKICSINTHEFRQVQVSQTKAHKEMSAWVLKVISMIFRENCKQFHECKKKWSKSAQIGEYWRIPTDQIEAHHWNVINPSTGAARCNVLIQLLQTPIGANW